MININCPIKILKVLFGSKITGRCRVMRVDAYNQINQIYNTNNKIKTQKTSKTSARDKVELSSFGKAYQVAKQAVQNAPDIREDKVAEIKAKMDNGTYDVSAEQFADKLLSKFESLV